MEFVAAAKNTMLGALTIDRLSLHTDIPDATGSNEVTGGSPAYARVTCSFDAASGGARAMETADPDPEFDVPAGTTVLFLGFWSNTGPTFHGWAPINGGSIRGVGQAVASSDAIESYAHGLVNGDRVRFKSIDGESVPAGLSAATVYFVVGSATDSFQVSTTLGGSAVNITANGEVEFIRIIPESFGSQGKLTVNTAQVDLNG